jgi:hypothetical protein
LELEETKLVITCELRDFYTKVTQPKIKHI